MAISISELRQHLPEYLRQAASGTEIPVSVHGRVVARLVPEPRHDQAEQAMERLVALRGKAKLLSSSKVTDEKWNAEQGLL